MNQEKTTPVENPSEALPQPEAALVPAVELCHPETLEELRDAEGHAQMLEAEGRARFDQARILRQHTLARAAKKHNLQPQDAIDLGTGAILRAPAQE